MPRRESGERELIAPWKALDDFLTGTLQNTLSGLSSAASEFVKTGRMTADAWNRELGSIVDGVVDLILQYTLFNAIRSSLDSLFHLKARASIVSKQAVGSAAQASSTAQSASAAATTAAAWSSAAIFASIGSFGAAGVIGLAVVLAALGAVAAGAFSKGGKVPGSPSREDDKIAAVASGELIIPSDSTQKLERQTGPTGIQGLLAGEIPVRSRESSSMSSDRLTDLRSHVSGVGARVEREILELILRTNRVTAHAAHFAKSLF